MTRQWALEPITADQPCGPNLDSTDDAEFVEYYFDAVGRLPERYVIPGMENDRGTRSDDRIFDPKTVRAAEEAKRIDALLMRSRDLRLLTLLAQFECLAGRLDQLTDVVETGADLIDTFGDALYPNIDGGASERRDILGELAQPVTILTALHYISLTGSNDVNLRRLKVADGKLTPQTGETDLSSSLMREALGTAGNRQKVDAIHAALLRLTDALNRINAACRTNPGSPFSPGLEPTLAVVAEMRAAITAARPDLRGAEADLPSATSEVPPVVAAQAPASAAAPAAAPPPDTATTDVPVASHGEARQALAACETYFQTSEPSSAALLLVRQARLLIGRPLIEALEVLLPEQAANAIISFGPQTGFALPAARLKALSGETGATPADPPTESAANAPEIRNGSDVAATLRGVEGFFRQHERSSPVPMLLQRARSYLDKDFQSLVDELIPRMETKT